MARYKGSRKAAQDAVTMVNAALDKIVKARMEVEDHVYGAQGIAQKLDESAAALTEARTLLEARRDRDK